MIFRRCGECKKIVIFKGTKMRGKFLCFNCKLNLLDDMNNKLLDIQERKREISRKKAEIKGVLRNKKADEELKKQLLKPAKQKKAKTIKKKEIVKENITKPVKKKNKKLVIDPTKSILLIEAGIKTLKVTEFINGKKRNILNKVREIRRTHAGGFSAEKFQKHVDHQKRITLDWITKNLEKPGVLRPPYDEVIIKSNEEIKKGLLNIKEKLINHL